MNNESSLESVKGGLRLLRRAPDIDLLLEQTPGPLAPLQARTDWLFAMMDWIRNTGLEKTRFDFGSESRQVLRLQYLLRLLESNPNWKLRVAQSLRSIIADAKGLELFLQTGVIHEDHFGAELFLRLRRKLVFLRDDEADLSTIFADHLQSPEDLNWIELLDSKTLSQIVDLFHFRISKEEENWNSLRQDGEEALLLLALQVQSLGLSSDIRLRSPEGPFRSLPFYQLPLIVEEFLDATDESRRSALAMNILNQIQECEQVLGRVQEYLHRSGVSISVVYRIERLQSLMKRMLDLLPLLQSDEICADRLSVFMKSLVTATVHRYSVRRLIHQNFYLLAKKVVETNGETGEHYFTRNRRQYLEMLRRGFWGGCVMGPTTLIKFMIHTLPLSTFGKSALASFNYSTTFLAIHFSHFTLGTKQPSMTASALAARMQGDPKQLVDEIIHLIRSQFGAVLGNVLGVFPVVAVMTYLWQSYLHTPFLSPAQAVHAIHELSILGPTPLYAYFTGILLWISSVFSGWTVNWYAFHKISNSISRHRRLHYWIGENGSRALAGFLSKHLSGISANVSLGLLLGLTPWLFQWVGLEMQVRHVTLSTGALALALFSAPGEILGSNEFWLAICGILAMGVLNIVVSFGLALAVAVKARDVKAPQRKLIYAGVMKRILRRPWSLIWPASEANEKEDGWFR